MENLVHRNSSLCILSTLSTYHTYICLLHYVPAFQITATQPYSRCFDGETPTQRFVRNIEWLCIS